MLEADAKHLLTDVWTSSGLVAALFIMMFAPPSWQILDPILGFVMSAHIARTGIELLRRSVAGLMDEGFPPGEIDRITEIIVRVGGVAQATTPCVRASPDRCGSWISTFWFQGP